LNRYLKVLCLILAALYLASVFHRSLTPRPDHSHLSQLTERLALAGEFCDQVSPSLRGVFTRLALYLETDPQRRALFTGEALPVETPSKMSPELHLWSLYRGQPEIREQLRRLGYSGLLRLTYSAIPVLLILVTCAALSIVGSRETVPPRQPSTPWSLWGVLATYFAWDLTHTYLLSPSLRATLPKTPPFLGLALLQGLSLALLLLLLSRYYKSPESPTGLTASLGWIGQGYSMAFVGVFLIEEVQRYLGFTLPTPPVLSLLNKPGNVLLFSFLVVVLVPLYEELIFRRWLLGGLQPYLGPAGALWASSALFALAHASLLSLPALLLLGWVFGWTYLKSGSLLAVVVLHGLWNLTSVCHLMAAVP